MLLYWTTFLLLVAINIEAFCDSWPDEKGRESVQTVADLCIRQFCSCSTYCSSFSVNICISTPIQRLNKTHNKNSFKNFVCRPLLCHCADQTLVGTLCTRHFCSCRKRPLTCSRSLELVCLFHPTESHYLADEESS